MKGRRNAEKEIMKERKEKVTKRVQDREGVIETHKEMEGD